MKQTTGMIKLLMFISALVLFACKKETDKLKSSEGEITISAKSQDQGHVKQTKTFAGTVAQKWQDLQNRSDIPDWPVYQRLKFDLPTIDHGFIQSNSRQYMSNSEFIQLRFFKIHHLSKYGNISRTGLITWLVSEIQGSSNLGWCQTFGNVQHFLHHVIIGRTGNC